MHVTNPTSGFLTDSMAEVVRTLSRMSEGKSGRYLARTTRGVSVSQVNVVLRKLEAMGVVTTQEVPPTKLYSLNAKHVLTKPLVEMITAKDQLFTWLVSKLEKIPGLESVTLFGSVARGTDTLESDLDLFMVFRSGEALEAFEIGQSSLERDFFGRYGNELGITAKRMSDLPRMLPDSSSFMINILREGKTLFGQELTLLLDRTARETRSSEEPATGS